uniref:Uncharacterized protein n=1 Tax=Rhizophora mucronata TaxID=61149 RepID=A0A2P2MI54_RHIMU
MEDLTCCREMEDCNLLRRTDFLFF